MKKERKFENAIFNMVNLWEITFEDKEAIEISNKILLQ